MKAGSGPENSLWRLALGFVLLFWAVPIRAQTVRPVVVEYREEGRGRFEIVNDTLFPLNVVLEPKSFSISANGEPVFRPLDRHIHLKMSTMSFRIPGRQTHYIFYEAKADALPAWFVLASTISRFPNQSGLNVQLELPHTVYLLQKEPLRKANVRVQMAKFDGKRQRVVIDLENQGGALARILAGEVRSGHGEKSFAGFPLLPQSERRVEVPWDSEEPPGKIVLRFKEFTIEEGLILEKP